LFGKRRRQFDFRNPKIYRTTKKETNVSFNPKYIWLFLILILIGLAVWWFFYSQTFLIKNIEITGTVNDSIKAEIDKFYNKNIFLFVIGQSDMELAKKQTSIERLNIIKGIPDTLKIEVLVRKPDIRWKTKDKIYFIDENGIIFNLETQNEDDNKLPCVVDGRNLEIKLGSKAVTSDFVDFIKKLAEKLPEESKKEIAEMRIEETTLHLTVKFKDSYQIFFDTLGSFDDQLYLLKKTIEKHNGEIKEYIDLRVDGKAYYK